MRLGLEKLAWASDRYPWPRGQDSLVESRDDDVHLRVAYLDLAVVSDVGQVGVNIVQEGHQAYNSKLHYSLAFRWTGSLWNQAVPPFRQTSRKQENISVCGSAEECESH